MHRHSSDIEIPPKSCFAARIVARKASAAIVNSGLTPPSDGTAAPSPTYGLVRMYWAKTSAHTELKGLEPSQALNCETGKSSVACRGQETPPRGCSNQKCPPEIPVGRELSTWLNVKRGPKLLDQLLVLRRSDVIDLSGEQESTATRTSRL